MIKKTRSPTLNVPSAGYCYRFAGTAQREYPITVRRENLATARRRDIALRPSENIMMILRQARVSTPALLSRRPHCCHDARISVTAASAARIAVTAASAAERSWCSIMMALNGPGARSQTNARFYCAYKFCLRRRWGGATTIMRRSRWGTIAILTVTVFSRSALCYRPGSSDVSRVTPESDALQAAIGNTRHSDDLLPVRRLRQDSEPRVMVP